MPGARGPRALDEAAAAKRDELGADDARGFHPAGEADQHDQHRHGRPQHDRHNHQQRQPGHGEEAVGDAHQHGIDGSPGVAGDAADRHAAGAGDDRGQQADGERYARAVEHAREHVASELVGPEPVRRRRRRATDRQVDAVRGGRRQPRRRDGGRDQRGENERRNTHQLATRGLIAACSPSAATLNTITADDDSISSAISTV